jgi:hypothetical protein
MLPPGGPPRLRRPNGPGRSEPCRVRFAAELFRILELPEAERASAIGGLLVRTYGSELPILADDDLSRANVVEAVVQADVRDFVWPGPRVSWLTTGAPARTFRPWPFACGPEGNRTPDLLPAEEGRLLIEAAGHKLAQPNALVSPFLLSSVPSRDGHAFPPLRQLFVNVAPKSETAPTFGAAP